MKGYKGMKSDMTCKGFQYKIGETYTFDGDIEICKQGFHFCQDLINVFFYYSPANLGNRFFEVEASDNIIEGLDKCVTSKIKIIRELSRIEVYRIVYGNGDGLECEDDHRYGSGNGFGDGYQNGYRNENGHGYVNIYISKQGHGYGYGWGCNGYNIQQVLKFS